MEDETEVIEVSEATASEVYLSSNQIEYIQNINECQLWMLAFTILIFTLVLFLLVVNVISMRR